MYPDGFETFRPTRARLRALLMRMSGARIHDDALPRAENMLFRRWVTACDRAKCGPWV